MTLERASWNMAASSRASMIMVRSSGLIRLESSRLLVEHRALFQRHLLFAYLRRPVKVEKRRRHQELSVRGMARSLEGQNEGFWDLEHEHHSFVTAARSAIDGPVEHPHTTVIALGQIRPGPLTKAVTHDRFRVARRVVQPHPHHPCLSRHNKETCE